MSSTRALSALLRRRTCASCGAPEGILFQASTYQDYYCPKCAQEYAQCVTANDQLEAHVRLAVEAWLAAWGHVPGIVDLEEQLRQIGATLAVEYDAGFFPAVDPEVKA